MRIIAGEFRRRTLSTPPGTTTRPTTDRVREALFAHLELARLDGGFHGRRVLDLFAGSGALGLEALSRGAAFVTAVERDRNAVRAIRDNVRALGCGDRYTLHALPLRAALRRLAEAGPFDVVFADPPYSIIGIDEWIQSLADVIAPRCHVVYEHAAETVAPALPTFEGPAVRRFGDTSVSLYARAGA